MAMHEPFIDGALNVWVSFCVVGGRQFLFSCTSQDNALAIQALAQNAIRLNVSAEDFSSICGPRGHIFCA
jgi:hypothetical protein